MANITSVRALARSPSYAGPVICGILWAVFLLARVWVFGVLLFGATIVWATNLKSQYTPFLWEPLVASTRRSFLRISSTSSGSSKRSTMRSSREDKAASSVHSPRGRHGGSIR